MHRRTPRRARYAAVAAVACGGPVAGLAALAVCLLAALLVPLGWWRPAVVLPALAATAVPLAWVARRAARSAARLVPARAAVACLLLSVGFALWAGLTHGEHVILRRDPGAYALFAQWLATRHGLPVTGDVSAFGGAAATHVPGFSLGSPAFYQTGVPTGDGVRWQVTPQFLVGAPALYSIGWWLGGWSGLFWAPALVAGAALLAFSGLAVRLLRPRWAVLATAVLAVSQPLLHNARATYSEPPSLLLLLTGGVFAVDAVASRDAGRARRLGLLAGLVVGLAGLVRIDALREVAVLVAVCAGLALRRHPAAVPLAGGALAGVTASAVPAWQLSRPYVQGVWPESLRPLAAATAGLVVAAVVAVTVARCRDRLRGTAARPAAPRRPWPGGLGAGPAAGAVVVAGIVLAARPAWSVARNAPGDPGEAMIGSLQARQGLPVDGLRTYAEQSVRWLLWYTGPVVPVAALLAFAALAAAAARWWRGRGGPGTAVPPWLVPAAVGLGSTLATLYRPGITPDHPWADRRLVTVVLPTTVLAATAAAAHVVRRARDREAGGGGGHRTALVLRGGLALALLLPPAATTVPVAFSRTETGEPEAVAAVCSALRPGDVVAMVSDGDGGTRAQNEWVQVVRGVCGRPSVSLSGSADDQRRAVAALGPLARAAGNRLVLLAAADTDGRAAAALTALGTRPARAASLVTREDERLLTRPSVGTARLVVAVWLGAWTDAG